MAIEWSLTSAAQVLVMVLLHTLWQAAAAAVLVWLALRAIPASRSDGRYALALAGLGAVVLSALLTAAVLMRGPADAPPAAAAPAVPEYRLAPVETPTSYSYSLPAPPGAAAQASPAAQSACGWHTYAAGVWLAGALLMVMRTARGVVGVHRIVGRCGPADTATVDLVNELRGRVGVLRAVRVVLCDALRTPAVFGAVWPVILLPPATLAGVTPEQLRVILVHELAHIRRHDYLVNLVQLLLEALLFFNPAVWWVSRQVRIEREACCDAAAAAAIGERTAAARALVDFVAFASAPPAVAPAFARPDRAGELVDRVKRLIHPTQRPAVHVPARTLATVALLVAAGLVVLQLGAGLAVEAAAELLSPQERIEKFEEIAGTHGRESDREYTEADDITISGTIRTADGSPLPEGLRLTVLTQRKGGSWFNSLKANGSTFSGRVNYGDATIYAKAGGFAPIVTDTFEAEPGGRIEGIELVLDRGFSGRIRLHAAGRPLAGVAVHYAYRRSSQHSGDIVSDSSGVVTIEHASPEEIVCSVSVPGYQHDKQAWQLTPDGVANWELIPAAPAQGVVVSNSGEAVPNAKIWLVRRNGFDHLTIDPRSDYTSVREPLATTDTSGRYTLDTLRDDCSYALMIGAEGYGWTLVEDVRSGESSREIRLPPSRHVRGRIVGDLSKLRDRRSGPRLSYRNRLEVADSSSSHQLSTPVEVRDGVGYFEITNLISHDVEIEPPGRSLRINQPLPIDDLVIDLTEPKATKAKAAAPATRSVIVRFETPKGWPAPTGMFRVDHVDPDRPRDGYQYRVWPIENGEVRLEVPTPTRIMYQPQGTRGFWIERKSEIVVEPGDEPFVLNVPAEPAGAVYGEVLAADGSRAEAFNVSIIVVDQPPSEEQRHLSIDSVWSDTGAFLCPPLPLGGTYAIIASPGRPGSSARVTSEPFRLDDATPFKELSLRFPEGVTVAGTVRGPNGEPIAGAGVSLNFSVQLGQRGSWSSGTAEVFTDRAGGFEFLHVNPYLKADYKLRVAPGPQTQGIIRPITPSAQPIDVQLKMGETLRGVVIEHTTGRVIPNATMKASPVNYAEAAYNGVAETRTDHRGRFEFHNLETIRYRLQVEDTLPADAVVTSLPDGRYSYTYRDQIAPAEAEGGQQEPAELRVQLRPGANLQPIAAP